MPATAHATRRALAARWPLPRRNSEPLREIFSEAALIRERVRVEAPGCCTRRGPGGGRTGLAARRARATGRAAARRTRARPTYRRQAHRGAHQSRRQGGRILRPRRARGRRRDRRSARMVHFGCTSEDINNLTYALLLKRARDSAARAEARGARRGDRRARAAPRGCGHARAHARSGRQAHHPRQGARELRRAPASGSARASRSVEILGKMERRSGQLQRTRGRPAARRLAAVERAVHRLARPGVEHPTPRRSSRTTGSPSTAMRSRASTSCSSICAATCGAISPSAISARSRWPGRSAPPPCRTR